MTAGFSFPNIQSTFVTNSFLPKKKKKSYFIQSRDKIRIIKNKKIPPCPQSIRIESGTFSKQIKH